METQQNVQRGENDRNTTKKFKNHRFGKKKRYERNTEVQGLEIDREHQFQIPIFTLKLWGLGFSCK
jgi:hypothetical protein